MATETRQLQTHEDSQKWDSYVLSHPRATLYHLSGWKRVIEKTYGHKGYYLIAEEALKNDCERTSISGKENLTREDVWQNQAVVKSCVPNEKRAHAVVGVLPLVHMKNFFFGNVLVSIPFLDFGGVLSKDDKVSVELLGAALELRERLGADVLELRHVDLAPFKETNGSTRLNLETVLRSLDVDYEVRTHKVRMLLNLPGSGKKLLDSFKSKLRSQIKRALKEGLETRIGREDLLADFYKVFSENMRDLGSPVHSMGMMKNVLTEFADPARIIMVYAGREPVACGMMIGFRDVMEHPWASALRKYSSLSPNMLLYWAMLEYSCERGFKVFDFGRSSPNEGTYKFKEQWGAIPSPLQWYYVRDEKVVTTEVCSKVSEDARFKLASEVWKRLPVSLTRIAGPQIRKYIAL
jgi:serine/alanine adding enzyme